MYLVAGRALTRDRLGLTLAIHPRDCDFRNSSRFRALRQATKETCLGYHILVRKALLGKHYVLRVYTLTLGLQNLIPILRKRKWESSSSIQEDQRRFMMFNHFCSIYLRIRYVLLKLACLICVPMSCLHTFTDKLPCCVNQDIIRLPRLFQFLQQPLAKLISVLRAPKSKEGYAAIGGGSPLRKITDEQVEQIHNLSC